MCPRNQFTVGVLQLYARIQSERHTSVRSEIQTMSQVTGSGAECQECDNFHNMLRLGQNWSFFGLFRLFRCLRLKMQPELTNKAKI
jgi:hypothetical protein